MILIIKYLHEEMERNFFSENYFQLLLPIAIVHSKCVIISSFSSVKANAQEIAQLELH